MKTAGQLLTAKGHDIWHIHPDASVYEAIEMMANKVVGALLVMDNNQLKGIISERDYARKVVLKGHQPQQLQVKQIMTAKVIYVTPETPVTDCMALMTEKRFRHLPVFDEGGLIGLISIGDLVKAIIHEQQFIIEQLEVYINS